MYEPYTEVLSRFLMMPLPGWLPKPRATDNWQTSAFENSPTVADQPFRKCIISEAAANRRSHRARPVSDAAEGGSSFVLFPNDRTRDHLECSTIPYGTPP